MNILDKDEAICSPLNSWSCQKSEVAQLKQSKLTSEVEKSILTLTTKSGHVT